MNFYFSKLLNWLSNKSLKKINNFSNQQIKILEEKMFLLLQLLIIKIQSKFKKKNPAQVNFVIFHTISYLTNREKF